MWVDSEELCAFWILAMWIIVTLEWVDECQEYWAQDATSDHKGRPVSVESQDPEPFPSRISTNPHC